MGRYIWQHKDWPRFTWQGDALLALLGQARQAQGRLLAQANLIGLTAQSQILAEEAYTTSAIEGEKLDRNSIRSSIAKRLGLSTVGLPAQQRHIEGLIEMLIDATANHSLPLTAARLQGWQAALFPTGFSGIHKIQVGLWRKGTEPMRVISGPMGREKIHFEAPPSAALTTEMKSFFQWWKDSQSELDGIIRAAVGHLWFVTIHPFDDGNGRVARAITDMALAQDERMDHRLYSLSSQILREHRDYYQILERTQRKDLDITDWLVWFLEMYLRALTHSQKLIQKTMNIAQFWQSYDQRQLHERQIKVIQRLLEAEPEGFEGGLTNRKYVGLTKVSRETAKRDIAELEEKGLLKRNPGRGRSVSYSLNLFLILSSVSK